VKAESESQALGFVPASRRSRAKVTPLTKFTPEDIRKAHEAHM